MWTSSGLDNGCLHFCSYWFYSYTGLCWLYRVFQRSSGCPKTYSIDQTGLTLRYSPASAHPPHYQSTDPVLISFQPHLTKMPRIMSCQHLSIPHTVKATPKVSYVTCQRKSMSTSSRNHDLKESLHSGRARSHWPSSFTMFYKRFATWSSHYLGCKFLRLELLVAVSCHMGAESQTWVLCQGHRCSSWLRHPSSPLHSFCDGLQLEEQSVTDSRVYTF